MFKINKKNTRMTSLTSFLWFCGLDVVLVFLLLFWKPFSSVFIVDFEQPLKSLCSFLLELSSSFLSLSPSLIQFSPPKKKFEYSSTLTMICSKKNKLHLAYWQPHKILESKTFNRLHKLIIRTLSPILTIKKFL